ncbi:molybdopterin dinucleotide binding domain-containing protein [Shigella flexneri]
MTVLCANCTAVANREPVTIHPDDAAARGITEGDMVRM